jgi:signal transduction histidine kinase
LWSDNGWNEFEVADTGIGIPPDELPNVFDRFHRGANVNDRRFTGMGLGLYICRGIVEQHGGQIWVESRPNKGSTFHVALPAPMPTREEQLERGEEEEEEAKRQVAHVAIQEVHLDA